MGKESLATVDQRVKSLAFSDSELGQAKAKILALLDATVIVRGTSRTAGGSPIYEERTDNAVQLAAAKLVFEYSLGKPTTQIDLNTTPQGGTQQTTSLPDLMRKNPALAKHIIDSYIDNAKAAQSVDVETVKADSPARPPE